MLADLETLRCFCTAADLLNFRRAAAAVNLSPQAFSTRIRNLEESLDASLFERTTRRVHLTQEGFRLLPHAREVLRLAKECYSVVHDDAVPAVEATIGTRFELGLSWVSPSLQALAKDRPNQVFHLSFGDAPTLLTRVIGGEIDAMISSSRLENVPVEYEALHQEEYVFVGAKSLLRASPVKKIGDLKQHLLLDERRDLPLFRYLRDHTPGSNIEFREFRFLGTIGAIHHWCRAGAGLAVLPKYLIEKDLKSGRIQVVLPKIKIAADHFRLVWRTGSVHEPAFRALADQLRLFPLK